MVGLDDLRKVLLTERETAKLTQISHDIFSRAHSAILTLLEKVYAIEDPLSDEARTLIEETVSIRETACDLFALRTRKILLLAEGHAQGHYIDREEVKKMIPAEREMFDRITAAIAACEGVLVQNTPQARLPVQEDAPVPTEEEEEPAQGSCGSTPPRKPAPPATPPYALVRVLADMDAFMGVDGKTYTLEKGDIIMLPERNAEVLVERNIALNMNVCK
jgi:DNA replication factor GINS